MGSLGVSGTVDDDESLLALTGLDLLFSKTVARAVTDTPLPNAAV